MRWVAPAHDLYPRALLERVARRLERERQVVAARRQLERLLAVESDAAAGDASPWSPRPIPRRSRARPSRGASGSARRCRGRGGRGRRARALRQSSARPVTAGRPSGQAGGGVARAAESGTGLPVVAAPGAVEGRAICMATSTRATASNRRGGDREPALAAPGAAEGHRRHGAALRARRALRVGELDLVDAGGAGRLVVADLRPQRRRRRGLDRRGRVPPGPRRGVLASPRSSSRPGAGA